MPTLSVLAQFPPPIHGLSKAVDTLYKSKLHDKYKFEKIDITQNKYILRHIKSILKSNSDCFYVTISQSKAGNWRDLLYLQLIAWKKKKCIIHLHGGYYRQLLEKDCSSLQRNLNIKVLQKINAAIVLGESLKSIFNRWVSDEKIFVVPNCVDNQYISLSIENKMKNLGNQKKIHLLYLSNFIASKGYREVLETALHIKEQGLQEGVMFHFAGKFYSKEDNDYFFSYIKRFSLDNLIEYHGIVSGEAKNQLLQQCNIFMLLTKYPKEGQPISILEAMGNGMAIITTNHAGIPDIANKNNGYICDKTYIRIEDIVAYIKKCYYDRKALIQTCEYNYNVAQALYTESNYINNLDNVFQSVLAEKNN